MTSRTSALAVAVLMALAVVVSAASFARPVAGQGDAGDLCIILYPDGTWHYNECPPTPTPEYGTPEPTATPLPTVTPTPEPACVITATANINIREVPGGAYVATFPLGSTVIPDAMTTFNGMTYYRFWWPFVTPAREAWAADYFTETGPCAGLPVEDPF